MRVTLGYYVVVPCCVTSTFHLRHSRVPNTLFTKIFPTCFLVRSPAHLIDLDIAPPATSFIPFYSIFPYLPYLHPVGADQSETCQVAVSPSNQVSPPLLLLVSPDQRRVRGLHSPFCLPSVFPPLWLLLTKDVSGVSTPFGFF